MSDRKLAQDQARAQLEFDSLNVGATAPQPDQVEEGGAEDEDEEGDEEGDEEEDVDVVDDSKDIPTATVAGSNTYQGISGSLGGTAQYTQY